MSTKHTSIRNISVFLTGTYAHQNPGYDDDLIGPDGLADPHHHGRNDGEDVVEEEGALSVILLQTLVSASNMQYTVTIMIIKICQFKVDIV